MVEDRLRDWAQWQKEEVFGPDGYRSALQAIIQDNVINEVRKRHIIQSSDSELWETEHALCQLKINRKQSYLAVVVYYVVGESMNSTAKRLNTSRDFANRNFEYGIGFISGILSKNDIEQ